MNIILSYSRRKDRMRERGEKIVPAGEDWIGAETIAHLLSLPLPCFLYFVLGKLLRPLFLRSTLHYKKGTCVTLTQLLNLYDVEIGYTKTTSFEAFVPKGIFFRLFHHPPRQPKTLFLSHPLPFLVWLVVALRG